MMTKPVVLERRDDRDGDLEIWSVEQIDEPEGDCYVTVFYGPASEERARAYAEWLEWKSGP